MSTGVSLTQADAERVLSEWDAPGPSQEGLAQAYLGFLAARPDATDRTCTPGHLTASALVFDHDLTHIALVLHGRFGIWIQAGGHIEPSDVTLREAATREVREELGLEVDLIGPATLNVHPVICRGYTEVTRHFDVRFVGRAAPGAELTCSSESRDVAWWPLDALPEGLRDELHELITLGRARLAAQ